MFFSRCVNSIIFLISFFVCSSFSYAKMQEFPLTDDPIDVVIPCVEKDMLTLNLCIQGIRLNGANIRRIIILSKKPLTNEAEWFDESLFPFSFKDIASSLAKHDPLLTNIILNGGRVGWYYQQLLKLYAPLIIPDISSNVLVLDADTIFLNPVDFLNKNNGGMYNLGYENHIPYFEHMSRLIPGFSKCFPDYSSGISHHMIFQKPILESLLEEVETEHQRPFWEAFCFLVDPQQISHSGASEYEIYINYAFSHTSQISIRLLQWRNIEKLSEIVDLKNRGFHYASIHSYNRSLE